MSVTKRFSPELYAKFDNPAKRIVGHALARRGWTILDDEDYGPDLCAIKGSGARTSWHEVEVKNVWEGSWPEMWKTIQIPERKIRLFEKVDELFFWVVSKDNKQAWVIDSKVALEAPVVEVKNRYVPSGELFMQIPIENALLVRF
jgi:hypothetical protein